MAKSGDTIGGTGGGADIFASWATVSHTLTEAQIPVHTHTIPGTSGSGGSIDGGIVDGSTSSPNFASGAAGGGGSHSHNMTTPYYDIWAAATKDA
jgi:microcystin-dependent protein